MAVPFSNTKQGVGFPQVQRSGFVVWATVIEGRGIAPPLCYTFPLHSASCVLWQLLGSMQGADSLIRPWGPGAAILHRIYDFYATSEALEEGLNAHSKAQPQTF